MLYEPTAHGARRLLAKVVAELGSPPLPVRFRTQDITHCGECEHRADHFRITLAKTLSRREHLDTVIHELAHVYAWTHGAAYRGDHDEIWGVMFARIYCAARGEH
jgi:hypothetical protein